MKNLKFIAFTIVAMLFTVTNVYAQEVGTADELSSCIATDGNTCTLTADITVETKLSFAARKTITIDLNGHTIKLEGSNTQLFVLSNGTLIIEDSVGEGLITNADSTAGNQYPIQVAGNLVINGGTLENARPNLYTVYVQSTTSTCTLNDGTIINSYNKGGKAVYNKGVFTMNGGKVESKAAGSDGLATAIEGHSVKINGGTIEAAGTAITATGQTVEITGGTINAGWFALHTRYATIEPAEGKEVNITAGRAAIIAYSAPTTGKANKIYGGNFIAPTLMEEKYVGDSTNVEVYGGTYSVDVNDYVVDGKYAEKVGEVYEIKEYTQTPDITPVDPEEEVEDTTIGVTDNEETGNILMDSLEEFVNSDISEETKETIKNNNVVVVVDVTSLGEDELDEEVLEKIETAAKDLVIADYFDIMVLINDDQDNTLGVITNLTEKIELMVLLPEELVNTDEKVERKYYVIREHDGEVEIIEDVKLSEDGKSLIFESDKFSTYAIAYEDEILPPKTGDGIATYFIMTIVSLIAMAGIALVSKKQFN